MTVRRTLMMLCVACAAGFSSAYAQGPDVARADGWRSDVDYFLRELQAQHYVLRGKPLPDSIRATANRLKDQVGRWSDERALAELMRLAAMAGDGHTYVLPFGAEKVQPRMLPIRFHQFADGMYVIDADDANARWIGAEVRSLAGAASAELMARIRPYVSRDNETGILWVGPFLLRFVGYLEAITDRSLDDIRVGLRRDGRDTIVSVRTIAPPRMRGVPKLIASRIGSVPPPLYLRDVERPYWMTSLNDSILYVQFNQVQNDPAQPLATFARSLQQEVSQRQLKLMLVDVRHNNGGNAELLHPLIATLREYRDRGGRVVVISGRNTFSAAQIFLSRAEHEAGAVVIGEPSSSKPNFVGEENGVMLPWSGAIASISNRYHETIPGDTRTVIPPRPHIPLRSSEYFANRDPVLEAVLGGRAP